MTTAKQAGYADGLAGIGQSWSGGNGTVADYMEGYRKGAEAHALRLAGERAALANYRATHAAALPDAD